MFPPRGARPRLSAFALVALLGLLGALASPVAAQTPPSTDATLSGLELSEGRLDPDFASGTTSYAAAVGYTVTRITVSPTRNDASAAVEFLDGGDNPLPDADGSTDGLQVDLTVGDNTIKVEVTAEDGTTVNTYTLTITRTAEDTSLSPPASDPVAASPSTAVYDVVFHGRWITAVTPGGVPSGAHFSRLIGGVHSDAVTFLESGGTASAGVESMAEVGGWTALQGEVQGAGAGALSVLAGDTDSISPTTSKTLTATLTTEHPRITLVTMVAPSPDWFVGVSGLPLLDAQGRWLRSHEVHLYPWDAGTEDGSEFSLTNVATSPQGVITSIRGTDKFSTERIATLSFALRSVSTTRRVAENTAAGTDIGAPFTIPGASTATYTLGGTDAASFDIVPATGQLQTKATLDYETKSGYEVTVTGTDTDGSVTTTVAIEVTNVIELTTTTGPAEVTFAENGAGRVASYTSSSEEDQGGVVWTVAGADGAHFTIDALGGALRFHIDPIAPNIFPKLPDFESPDDADPDNDYEITLLARAGSTISAAYAVTVTVTDVDEAGAISLSATRPSAGSSLTATLNDPDGVTGGTTTWQWERSTGRNSWAVIEGAASASYTPVAADTNTFLRVTATYADEHGTGKTVSEVPPNVVTGPLLTGLTAETDDSQAAPARGLYPAFDPQTLHYGIGCSSTDTLVLTVSAAANARVAVAGVQAASTPMAVDVSEDSDVAIRVTDASGADTTYVVHCLPEVFFEIETHTFPNTDAFEDLLLLNLEDYFTLMDRNGVPRFHRGYSGLGGFAIRFHRIGIDGAYRYGFRTGGNSYTILDEDFEAVDDDVSTVAPLTRTNTHDFQILEDGNYLLMSYEPAMRDFSDIDLPYLDGADVSSVDVRDAAFQIVTPGRHAVFTWNSWGNMAIEDCVQHRFPVTLSTDPDMRSPDTDYAHINGMHVVDGVLAASIRGCSKVLGIDVEPGATRGDVLWRMGRTNLSDAEWSARDIGPRPLDFINDPEGEFCGQHTARFLPNGNVFLFDNGVLCVIDPWTFEELGREGYDFSRAVEYALDLENHEAVFVRDHSLRAERSHLGYANGNVDVLDNGDWLVSWGRALEEDRFPDNEMATLVDPATGQEKLGIRFRELPASSRSRRIPAAVAPAEALAPQPVPLAAEFPASDHTSLFHTGTGDAPQAIVAFNQPVVDFDETSPSLSVTGATVASVSAHVVAGEPANAYLVTLAPDGDGAISFRLDTGQACGANGGICTADGTALSEAPSALVISAPVIVSFEQSTYTVTEGASRFVTVLLSSAHQGVRSVTIPVVRQQTTGSASADDLTLDESVTFEAGETRKSLELNATDDDLVEGDETATLEFDTLPDGVTAGSTSTATITIADADQAQIAFTTVVTQISEGGQTQLTFEITNGVTFEVDQTINLTVTGTATGDDFTLANAGGQILSAPYSIAFPARATAVSATLRAVDDSAIEPVAESITLSAQLDLTGANLGSRTVTIPASDVPDTPVVTIAAGGPVSEGQDATFTLTRTVSQSLPLSAPLTVSVEVTATGSTLSGSPAPTVRFEGGDATADLAVLTLDDSVVEPPGTVTALIQGSTSNPPVYLTEPPNNATVTVNDDDVAAFTLSASNEEVAEGAAVTVTIVADGVTFAGPQTITLTLTLGGTATPVDDFTLVDGGRELSNPYVVTLPAGARSVSVMIMAVTDSEDDADETIDLSVSHEGSGIGSVTITITEAPIILPPVITGGGGGGGGGGPSGPSPSEVDFEWNVTRDIEELDSGHDDPTGAWSDGVTLWIAENGSGADDAIYAYDLESGERVEDREFDLDAGNLAPRGVWSDRTTIWISDSGKDKLFAHDLGSGERLPDSDLALHDDNDDPRGIWSDGSTMWVLDSRDNALFAYDLETGELLAEYALDSDNDDPHGIWSDRVSVWVSDHNDKRLFAYRLPALKEEDTSADEDVADEEEDLELERVTDEEFKKLSGASNNSPRGLWSDGDVMYVADASDGKVYTYNMPDAIDARLASLTLSGVDFGEFDSAQAEYAGTAGDDVTETTVGAEAAQSGATVLIEPDDADDDGDPENGHQVALEEVSEITVTVTSADGSRERVYRVLVGDPAQEAPGAPAPPCFRGAVALGFSLVVYAGGSVAELVDCAQSRHGTALYTLHDGDYVPYILGAPDFVNSSFGELFAGGLPASTPLIIKSDGPPTADPAGSITGDDPAPPWPECLRGTVATGFSLVLYQGGAIEELLACAESRNITAIYALDEGGYAPYILGAPDFVNRSFRELFADGLPAAAPLIVKSDGVSAAGATAGAP